MFRQSKDKVKNQQPADDKFSVKYGPFNMGGELKKAIRDSSTTQFELIIAQEANANYIKSQSVPLFDLALEVKNPVAVSGLLKLDLNISEIDTYYKKNGLCLLRKVYNRVPDALPLLYSKGDAIDWQYNLLYKVGDLTVLKSCIMYSDLKQVKLLVELGQNFIPSIPNKLALLDYYKDAYISAKGLFSGNDHALREIHRIQNILKNALNHLVKDIRDDRQAVGKLIHHLNLFPAVLTKEILDYSEDFSTPEWLSRALKK